MRKIRREVIWFLVGLAISQALIYGLKLYNNALQVKYEALNLKAEDYSIEFEEDEKLNVIAPCSTSSVKSYMDYRKITSKTSDQYQYIKEHMTVKDGYLVDDEGHIGVALGSFFGEVGTRWTITLSSGIELNVVKIEVKDDIHTIEGCEHKVDGSVIEFVIDEDHFEKSTNGYVYQGNFNNIDEFKGEIVSLERK